MRDRDTSPRNTNEKVKRGFSKGELVYQKTSLCANYTHKDDGNRARKNNMDVSMMPSFLTQTL